MRNTAMGALVLVLALPALGDERTFSVGTATAARGQKAFGAIEVPAGGDAGTRIAVALVNGAKPGPVLAIVSGAHGTEYASIVAVSKLVGRLEPAEVSGTVILIPLVNVSSFEQKVPHVNPVDGKTSRSASTTSSSRRTTRRIPPPRATSRTPPRRAARLRSPSRPGAPARSSPTTSRRSRTDASR
jgi:predicted deacylase